MNAARPFDVALIAPAVAAVVAVTGARLAAAAFPGGYDWQYMAMSTLASTRHNPPGGAWFALALSLALLVLWPVTRHVARVLPSSAGARFAVAALRVGVALGALVGVESLVSPRLRPPFDQLHELIALLSFVSLYAGTVAACVSRLRAGAERMTPSLLLGWYTALGAVLLWLWLGQRELGWVGRHWRELGIPAWRSFAAWQWIACGSVLVAFACFAWAWRPRARPAA